MWVQYSQGGEDEEEDVQAVEFKLGHHRKSRAYKGCDKAWCHAGEFPPNKHGWSG